MVVRRAAAEALVKMGWHAEDGALALAVTEHGAMSLTEEGGELALAEDAVESEPRGTARTRA
jgi:hypothetical protein